MLSGELGSGPAGALCNQFAERICSRIAQCSPTVLALGYGNGRAFASRVECVERLSLACESWMHTADARVQSDELARCGTQWIERSCAQSVLDFSRPELGCALSRGVRQSMQPCASNLQCASLRCEFRREGQCGQCLAETPTNSLRTVVGGPCVREACQEGQRCERAICQAIPVEGERCTSQCVPYEAVRCVDGLCLAAPQAALDDACGSTDLASRAVFICPSNSDCVNRNDFGRGVCARLRREGEVCTLYGREHCQFPAQCVRGRCALPSSDCQ
jgi:hypothetical protein